MKTLVRTFSVLCMLWILTVTPQAVWAAEENYTYDASENKYQLKVTAGGNITDALKEALNDASGTKGKPAVIVIPSGSYTVNLVKLTKSYVTIRAEGATMKFAGSSSNGQYVLRATESPVTGIKICGGTWDGAGLASAIFNFSGNAAVNDLTLEGCTLKNAKSTNVLLNNGKRIQFTGVTLENSDYSATIANTSDLILTGCRSSGSRIGIGIRYLKGKNNLLKDCTVTKSDKDGLQIKEKGTIVTIEGGSYNANGKNGISMTAGVTVYMKNADVSNNKSNGISPVGSASTVTVLTASDCKFNNNARHGVAGDSYAEINVKNSEANNNVGNGIGLNKSCKSTGLDNCTTNGNGACGIMIQEYSSCPYVKNCTANGNQKFGISVKDADTDLEGCVTNNNKQNGIYISNIEGYNKAAKVTVHRCQSNHNGMHGIAIDAKKTAVITKTELKNNRRSGVESGGTSLTIKGSGNVISGNGRYGALATAGKMYISNAAIKGNTEAGVCYTGTSTSGYLINSTMKGNGSGINVYEGAILSKLNNNTITDNKKYGIVCAGHQAGRKTQIKQCKKNTLSNPESKGEIYCYGNAVLPSSVKNQAPIKFQTSVKHGKTAVKGTAMGGERQVIKITVGKKTYSAKIKGGSFSVKTAKLKKNATIKAVITDKQKNKITAQHKVK